MSSDTPPSPPSTSKNDANRIVLSPASISMLSSSIAGITGRILLHPVDTVKARMQVQIKHPAAMATANLNKQVLYYDSTVDAVRKIFSVEGIRGFYRGLGVALAFSGPAQTIYLGSYEQLRYGLSKWLVSEEQMQRQTQSGEEGNLLVHFLAGFGAEAISCVVWVPHDVLKERLQVERNHNVKLKDIYRQVRTDGLRNLYKGYGITLGTFGPFSALYFLSYEKMKLAMSNWTQTPLHQLSTGSFLISASVAAGFSSVLTTPLDVLKTRFQVQRLSAAKAVAPGEDLANYSSAWDGFKKIWRHEGPRALWKGVTARVCYMAPNVAVIMVFYEVLKKQLGTRFGRTNDNDNIKQETLG